MHDIRTSKEKIQFRLSQDDGYPPIAIEGIWGDVSGSVAFVDNIPFYAYGVAPGDQISVSKRPDGLWFDKLLKSSGRSVFRIFVKNIDNIESVRRSLLGLSCPSEVDLKMGLVALEVPVDVPISPVLDYLMGGQKNDLFDFEEGVLRHDLPD